MCLVFNMGGSVTQLFCDKTTNTPLKSKFILTSQLICITNVSFSCFTYPQCAAPPLASSRCLSDTPTKCPSRCSAHGACYFLVPKKSGEMRPMLDLSQYHRFMLVQQFHMLTTNAGAVLSGQSPIAGTWSWTWSA